MVSGTAYLQGDNLHTVLRLQLRKGCVVQQQRVWQSVLKGNTRQVQALLANSRELAVLLVNFDQAHYPPRLETDIAIVSSDGISVKGLHKIQPPAYFYQSAWSPDHEYVLGDVHEGYPCDLLSRQLFRSAPIVQGYGVLRWAKHGHTLVGCRWDMAEPGKPQPFSRIDINPDLTVRQKAVSNTEVDQLVGGAFRRILAAQAVWLEVPPQYNSILLSRSGDRGLLQGIELHYVTGAEMVSWDKHLYIYVEGQQHPIKHVIYHRDAQQQVEAVSFTHDEKYIIGLTNADSGVAPSYLVAVEPRTWKIHRLCLVPQGYRLLAFVED